MKCFSFAVLWMLMRRNWNKNHLLFHTEQKFFARWSVLEMSEENKPQYHERPEGKTSDFCLNWKQLLQRTTGEAQHGSATDIHRIGNQKFPNKILQVWRNAFCQFTKHLRRFSFSNKGRYGNVFGSWGLSDSGKSLRIINKTTKFECLKCLLRFAFDSSQRTLNSNNNNN